MPTATRRAAGLVLDEGGFGKGAGLAAAVAALQPSVGAADDGISAAFLDLGGQVALVGAPAAGGGWTVAVADPRRRDREIVALTVDGGSLATSGNGERGFEVDGRRYGHILDPASGRPAPDFGSLTVWAADPQVADCLSTGLYVLGPRRAFALAAADPSIEVLVVEVLDGAGAGAARVPSPNRACGCAPPRVWRGTPWRWCRGWWWRACRLAGPPPRRAFERRLIRCNAVAASAAVAIMNRGRRSLCPGRPIRRPLENRHRRRLHAGRPGAGFQEEYR